MKFETHTLSNGMKVLLAPTKGSESVTVMIMTATGSRYETKKENGMAHFLEHMLFKGTKKRKTPMAISGEIDGVGGQFNAFTAKDHTAYYAKVDARHFDVAFGVISDIFLNPQLPAAELEKERGAVIEEINMYEDMPMRSVFVEADTTLFGANHPLGRTILGPKKNIQSFTRKEVLEYFQRNYVATNSALCIAGSFSKKKVLEAAQKTFKKMREGDLPTHRMYEHNQEAPRVHLKTKQTDQTHCVLSVPAFPIAHKDEIAAEIVAVILGGGMSSRLFTEVRERRGLAYYVKADCDVYKETGHFYMRAGVSNKNLEKTVQLILKETKKLTMVKATPAELRKAKEYLKGTTALSLETTDAQADYIGYTTLVRGNPESLEEFYKKVDAVSAEHVCAVAQDMFTTNKLNLTVIGPHKNEKKLLKLLKI